MPSDNVPRGQMKTLLRLNYADNIKYSVEMFYAEMNNLSRLQLDVGIKCYVMLCYVLCYEFLSRIASSVLRVNCYQRESCVRGPSAFNSPFGHGSRSHNIRQLDNHLSGLSISVSIISITIFQVFRITLL